MINIIHQHGAFGTKDELALTPYNHRGGSELRIHLTASHRTVDVWWSFLVTFMLVPAG